MLSNLSEAATQDVKPTVGGRVMEVVAYESMDHIGSNVCFISMWPLQRLDPCFRCFLHEEVNFVEIWYFLELGFLNFSGFVSLL